jgi:ankyrin repeat protein
MNERINKFIGGCKMNDVTILQECYNSNNNQIPEYYEKGLQWACVRGNLEAVKYLTNIGVNIDHEFGAPIRIASQEGHLEIVKHLVECGAKDVDWALVLAAYNNKMDIAQYLISVGADVTYGNRLAIRKCEEQGHTEMAKYLWDHYKKTKENVN